MKGEIPKIDPCETACSVLPRVEEALYFNRKNNDILPTKFTLINNIIPSAHSYPKPYIKSLSSKGTALQVGGSRVRFPMVSLEFFIDIILPAALWPHSASKRNEYQEYFLQVKAADA